MKAALTPLIIQPTTFAEIDGRETKRIISLSTIFNKSKIPYEIVKNMYHWQLCHLAMVVPIADAYYKSKNPEKVWKETKIMVETAKKMKINFKTLYNFGNIFMYQHSMKAKDEMRQLHKKFYQYIENKV